MKKILSIILTLTICSICSAKYTKGITTQEEYLYMNKGYKIAIESGLDIKSGYAIGKTYTNIVSVYTFDYKTLLRISGKDTVEVGYIVKIYSKDMFGETIRYLGMPIGNKVLIDEVFKTVILNTSTYASSFFKSYFLIKEVEQGFGK
jgi:hypothetical protein